MYSLGLVTNPLTLAVKRLNAAAPRTIRRIPAAILTLVSP
jgi:hypothetical protein